MFVICKRYNMQNIFRKKIRKNLPANHHNDVVFVADKIYCINKSENVMAIFNSQKDYLLDNAVEYTKTKEEFLSAMEKVWDALEDNKKVLKTFKRVNDLKIRLKQLYVVKG